MKEDGGRSRVSGKIDSDGSLRCTCGKKLGRATNSGVGIVCGRCNVEVEFDLRAIKAASLTRIAEMIAAI